MTERGSRPEQSLSQPSTTLQADCLLLYCRAGFEKETTAEILTVTRSFNLAGYVQAAPDSGYVLFHPYEGASALTELARSFRFESLIFPRQWVFISGPIETLPEKDRVTPLLAQVRRMGSRFSEVLLETADTNEAKSLTVFTRKFAPLLEKALRAEGLLGNQQAPRLHLFFLDSRQVYVGWTLAANAAPWPMGIPRLRFPRSAPSRSTLKLEEAFLFFVADEERDLRPGMTAVDLGAAPGGWTWQLVKRHIRTIAIDNGALHPDLLESGIVEHLRVDGFRYHPNRPVDWLVCDMVEQPVRIAERVSEWIAQGWCRKAIFNLKLPMKKRYEEVQRCRNLICERLERDGLVFELAFKQLYHDREEVTGYVVRYTPCQG